MGKTCTALQDLGTFKNACFEADFVSEMDLQTSVTRPVAGYVGMPRRREGSQLSQRNFSSEFLSLAGRWLAWSPQEVSQHTVGRGDSHCELSGYFQSLWRHLEQSPLKGHPVKGPLTGCLCLFSSGVSAQLEQNFTQLKFPHLHGLLVFVPTRLMSNPLDGLLHLGLCKNAHFQHSKTLPEGSPTTGAAGESLGVQRKTIGPGFPERRGR